MTCLVYTDGTIVDPITATATQRLLALKALENVINDLAEQGDFLDNMIKTGREDYDFLEEKDELAQIAEGITEAVYLYNVFELPLTHNL